MDECAREQKKATVNKLTHKKVLHEQHKASVPVIETQIIKCYVAVLINQTMLFEASRQGLKFYGEMKANIYFKNGRRC